MPMDLASKRVTVMGLGRFGGGLGVTRWLVSQGADVLVTDVQPQEQLAEPLAEIHDLVESGRVSLRLGEHNVSDFTTGDLVIANPAVPRPWDNRFIRSAMAAGVPVTTEIRLLTERIDRRRTIGVTGSAGKSTTAAMIHHILVRSGVRAHLGGNIGGSLLNDVGSVSHDEWIVLELSSAMLYWLDADVGFADAPGWSPHVAVLTNINPNHVDWHGTFEHYRDSKMNVFKHQRAAAADKHVRGDDVCGNNQTIALKIPGTHNQLNAHVALAAVRAATGFVPPNPSAILGDFPGLPHRLQLAAEHDRVRFFNDSKSTTPEATALAVEAFDEPTRIHLIAGGYDKGSDLTPIAKLCERIAGLYTIGKTGESLASRCRDGGFAVYCRTLEVAIDRAIPRTQRGDVVLLSPGCASWDQFINYEKRGDAFVRLVNEHFAPANSRSA